MTLAFVLSSKPLPVSNWKPGISFHCWQRPALPISTLHSDSLWSINVTLQLYCAGANSAFLPVEGILAFVLTYYHIKYPSQFCVIEKNLISVPLMSTLMPLIKKILSKAESGATALWHSISSPSTGCDRAIHQTSWMELYTQPWIHLIFHSRSPPCSRECETSLNALLGAKTLHLWRSQSVNLSWCSRSVNLILITLSKRRRKLM